MATWGVISGSCSQNTSRYFPKVYWKQLSQSIENNTTTIRVYSLVMNDGSTYDWNGTCSSWALTVNGVNRTLGSFNSNSDSGYTYPAGWTDGSNVVTTDKTELIPESGTTYQDFTITHNADGTKSVSVSHSYSLSSGGWGPGNVSISGTIVLETIPRASQPTLDDSTVTMRDQTVTINTNRASTGFTHTLTYSFGGASGTIATGVGASTTWTPPISLASQIPNAVSGVGTITCKTYSGSTLIGTKTVQITLLVPSDIKPTVSIGKTGVDLLSGYYVQNKSKVAVELTEAGAYGSTISNRQTTVNGATYTGDSFTTGVLKNSGTNDIDTTVTDSRGRTGTDSDSVSVVAYANPQATSLSAVRCDSDGTANDQGAYMKLNAAWVISAINNANSKSVTLRYKITGAESWTTADTDTSNYSGSFTDVIVAADVDETYEIELVVGDYYSTATRQASLSSAFTLMDFSANGRKAAFGKVADDAGSLVQFGDGVSFEKEGSHIIVGDRPFLASKEQTYGNSVVVGNTGSGATLIAGESTENNLARYHTDDEFARIAGYRAYMESNAETDDYHYFCLDQNGELSLDGEIVYPARGKYANHIIDLSNDVQTMTYAYSVIALCELPNDAQFTSYSHGILSFTRSNGSIFPIVGLVSFMKGYDVQKPKTMILEMGANKLEPCTFTYNGIKYGGIRLTAAAQYHRCYFRGVSTIDIFGIDYYRSSPSTILNSEVYNSINLSDHITGAGLYFDGASV